MKHVAIPGTRSKSPSTANYSASPGRCWKARARSSKRPPRSTNERDNFAVARAFGMKKAYDLYYRNHMLDGVSPLELRLRLIFLFRLLKVDTVVCYDLWGLYQETPYPYVPSSAVYP